jgi:hypothetical protein
MTDYETWCRLREVFPDGALTQVTPKTLCMKCPSKTHEDHNPSFYISLNTGKGTCLACGHTADVADLCGMPMPTTPKGQNPND